MKRNIINLANIREAKAILATASPRSSLYRLAQHVINPTANPNPYGRRVVR